MMKVKDHQVISKIFNLKSNLFKLKMENYNISISKNIIPEYLKKSNLYNTICSLDEENNNFEMSIDRKYFKENSDINSLEELTELLHVLRYWMVNETPFNLYNFVNDNDKLDYSSIYETFGDFYIINEIKVIIKDWNMQDNKYKNLDKDTKSLIVINFMIKDCIINNFLNVLIFIEKITCKDTILFVNEIPEYPFTDDFTILACEYNRLNFLEYFYNIGFELKNSVYDQCLTYGSLNCLKYLYKKTGYVGNEDSCDTAVRYGNLECFKFLVETGQKPKDNIFETAVYFSKINCVKYIYDKDKHYNQDNILNICTISLQNKNNEEEQFEILKFLYDMGFKGNSDTCEFAAKNGYFECLKFLHSEGCEINENLCKFITTYGDENLECLIFASKNGSTLENVMSSALENGYVTYVKYLHENGFDLPNRIPQIIKIKKDKRYKKTLEYLLDNGCELH